MIALHINVTVPRLFGSGPSRPAAATAKAHFGKSAFRRAPNCRRYAGLHILFATSISL